MKMKSKRYPSGRMVTIYETRRAREENSHEHMIRFSSSSSPVSKWVNLYNSMRHGPYFYDGDHKVYLRDFEEAV